MAQKTQEIIPLIIAEYENLSKIMTQADEASVKSSEFFVIGFGTVFAAVFSGELFGDSSFENYLFLTLFIIMIVMCAYGMVTIYQLTRLRRAWVEAVYKQNDLKEFLFSKYPNIAVSFGYYKDKEPKYFNQKSVGFIKVIQIAIMSSFCFFGAIFIIFQALQSPFCYYNNLFFISLAVGVLQVLFGYIIPLNKEDIAHEKEIDMLNSISGIEKMIQETKEKILEKPYLKDFYEQKIEYYQNLKDKLGST